MRTSDGTPKVARLYELRAIALRPLPADTEVASSAAQIMAIAVASTVLAGPEIPLTQIKTPPMKVPATPITPSSEGV